jgi:hypothetical protein
MNAADWTAIAAGATAVAAGVTAWMAIETASVARANRDVATATKDLAEQSTTDRYLTWAPALGFPAKYHDEVDGDSAAFKLSNVGGGPALATRYVRRATDDKWFVTEPVALPPQDDDSVGASPDPFTPDITLLVLTEPPTGTALVDIVGALFCEDVFSNRYRFLVTSLTGHDRVLARQVWRVGTPAPQWADVASFWGPLPSAPDTP